MNPYSIFEPARAITPPNSLNTVLGRFIPPSPFPQTPVYKMKPSMLLTPKSHSPAKPTQPQRCPITPKTPCPTRNKAGRGGGDVLAGFYQGPTKRKTILPTPPSSYRLRTSISPIKNRQLPSGPPPAFSLAKKNRRKGQNDRVNDNNVYYDLFADSKRMANLIDRNFNLSLEIKYLQELIDSTRKLLSNEGKKRFNKSIKRRNDQAAKGKFTPKPPGYYRRIEAFSYTQWPDEDALNYETWLKSRELAESIRQNLSLESSFQCLSAIAEDLSLICLNGYSLY
ncbi:hypothetical protein H4219_004117 [Mycoemilia scoparia]|uniref:Uncharacterized protein n=1 Tax=Mycoemilia scoparia TaxID=417184 RepID=A0A9W8DRN8_9FUNG|nr:hypothetical protein H4219_004117 [Mycoemilia scoparia]